ncbi:MAG: hypothetical protein WCG98_10885 [bacterium]
MKTFLFLETEHGALLQECPPEFNGLEVQEIRIREEEILKFLNTKNPNLEANQIIAQVCVDGQVVHSMALTAHTLWGTRRNAIKNSIPKKKGVEYAYQFSE